MNALVRVGLLLAALSTATPTELRRGARGRRMAASGKLRRGRGGAREAGGAEQDASCFIDGEGAWVRDADDVRSRLRTLSAEARASSASPPSWSSLPAEFYPAEAYRGYDCELYTFAARLPGMAGYTHVLPFCERLAGQPIVQRVPRKSVEWKWLPLGIPPSGVPRGGGGQFRE